MEQIAMSHTQPPHTPRPRHLSLVHSQTTSGAAPTISEKIDEDAYASWLINGLVEHVQDQHVRTFFSEALSAPEIRQVLAAALPGAARKSQMLVRILLPVAKEAQRKAVVCTHETDAVFVACILHAVDYCFLPVMRAQFHAPDAMRTILRGALHRLDKKAPQSAAVLRGCMRWGNFDEEGVFVEWLEDRMHMALKLIDLSSF
jgi:hypothetical protein